MNVIQSQALPEAPSATCQNCGAAIVPDQRYCLTCGHPCSPVRLAFLDVLQSERTSQPPNVIGAPAAPYAPVWEQSGTVGLLQRYSGVFGLLTVLLVAGLIGLLVGHWASAGRTPAQSVFKVEGLSGLATAATPVAPVATTATPTTPTPTPTTPKKSSTKSSEAKEEASEAQAKTPPPAPKKTTSNTLNKLSHLKGKKYQQEINKLTEGDQPLETGGG
jgi:cell division septation protein DedD